MNTKPTKVTRKNMMSMKKGKTTMWTKSGTNEVLQKNSIGVVNLGVSDRGTQTRPFRLADIRREYFRILGINEKEFMETQKFGEIINRQQKTVAEKSSTKQEQRQIELQVRCEKKEEDKKKKIAGNIEKRIGLKDKREKAMESKKNKKLGIQTFNVPDIPIPRILGRKRKETEMTIPIFKVPGSPIIKVRRPYFVPGKNFALLKRTVMDTITISDDEEVPKKMIKKSCRSNAPTKDFESWKASTSEDQSLRDYLKIPTDADASEDDIAWMDDVNVDEEWWKHSMSEGILSEEAIRLEKFQEEEQMKKNKKEEAARLDQTVAMEQQINKKREEDRIKANIKDQIQKFEDQEKARLKIKECEEEKKRREEKYFRQDMEDYDRRRMRKDFQVNAVKASEKHQRRKVSRWN